MAVVVLFISSGNSVRSQMAEAFLRHLGGAAFDVHSAGSEARPVDSLTVGVLAERGIDISGRRSKDLQEYIGAGPFDYLITVCEQHEKACPVFPGRGTREYWPSEDPSGIDGSDEERVAAFREVRDQIEARIRRWLGRPRYQTVSRRKPEAATSRDAARPTGSRRAARPGVPG